MTNTTTSPTASGGPLRGLRVVEFSGIGPGPFACMLLADWGADVVRIERPGVALTGQANIIGRNRRVVYADLKRPDDVATVLALLAHADVLVEGYRPGVMERLGLGPEVVATHNPRLIYGRMTGWGQTGPLAQCAGHDINYIALGGALGTIGPAQGAPVPPLNLVGDYGGGSLYLVAGILAAVHAARHSGQGQVVDTAITDGTLSLMSLALTQQARGTLSPQRGDNVLDGGAPYYATYVTADGGYISIGAIEPQFFALLCERLEIDESLRDAQHDRTRWPQLRAALALTFLSATRASWQARLEGSDVCFAPVLGLDELATHPHLQARQALLEIDGIHQPAPAPRFSATPAARPRPAPQQAQTMAAILDTWRAAA